MNPQDSQQPTPLVQSEQSIEPKAPFPWLKVLLVIVLLTLIGSAGYYLGTINSKPAQVTTTQYPTSIPSPIPTTDPTANWKTYTSLNGYTIKYPQDVSFNTQVTNDAVEFEIKSNILDVTFWRSVSLPDNTTLDDFLNPPGLGPAPVVSKVSGITLDGVSISRYEGTQNDIPYIHIGIPLKNKRVFEIRAYPLDNSNKNLITLRAALDQILQTFKLAP